MLLRLAMLGPLVLFAYAMARTQSRGGMLALLAGLGLFMRTRFGWRIAAPESPIPHLLPEVARRNWSLTRTQDSLLLDSLSRAKR